MTGYIKLYRGWRDTDGLTKATCFSDAEAWLWLLENATWKDTTRWNGKGEEIRLKPGQIHVSLRSLASAWGWSKSKVERFLDRLERVGKAGQSAGQSGCILTIENWAKYQVDGAAPDTDGGTVAGQPRDTQEEGKEIKEDKKGAYAFSGKVIRLLQSDLARWQKSYSSLDVPALLQSRDDWLSGQPADVCKRWFQSTSNWLAKKQQEARADNGIVIGI